MIRIPKSILDDQDWLGNKFSKPMAWIDLMLLAEGNEPVSVSFRELGARWKWSTITVIRFLEDLEARGNISMFTQTFHGTFAKHLITVVSTTYKDVETLAKHSAKHSKKTAPPSPPDSSPCTPSLSPLLFPQEEIEESSVTSVPEDEKRPAPFDYDYVLNLWNSSMTRSVKKIVGLSVSRKEKIKLRIDEMGGWEQACATLATCFRKINESDFCNGKGDKKWVASFDWFFINDKNWTKVIEGNYDNVRETTPLDKLSENIAKADEYYEQRYRGYGGASAYGNPAGRRSDGPDEQ